MTRCVIEGCENTISPRSKLPLCPVCRGGIGRWMKRRPAEVLERRRRLVMYHDRMANIAAERRRRSR